MADESTRWRDSLERWMKENYWTPYGYQRWAAGAQVPDAEFWHNFDRMMEGHEMRNPRAPSNYDVLDLTPEDVALLKGMKIRI